MQARAVAPQDIASARHRDLRSFVTEQLRPVLEQRSVRISVVGTLLVAASFFTLLPHHHSVDLGWMFIVPVAISAIAGGLIEGVMIALAASLLGATYAMAANGAMDAGIMFSVASARFALYGITAAFLGVFADAHYAVQTRFRELASMDPLTKVSNVASFYEKLGVLQSSRAEFAMMLLDIDELKALNDHHGHQAGSQAIRVVADVVQTVVRSGDCVARYGGDEFVVTLKESGREGAEIVARRIEQMLSEQTLDLAPDVAVTVSIGIAVFGEDGMTSEELLSAADSDMYENKRARKAIR